MPFIQHLIAAPYDWQHLDASRLAAYEVHDIVPQPHENGNVILLLESPHTIEVLRGNPLAGRTGTNVTTALAGTLDIDQNERSWPFGDLLIANPAICPRLARVGAMNVCDIPMQTKFYRRTDVLDFKVTLLNPLSTIRTYPFRNRIGRTRNIDRALTVDLGARIHATDPNTYFIPCGEFARAYFHKAGVEREHYDNQNQPVPHPRNWTAATPLAPVREEIVARTA